MGVAVVAYVVIRKERERSARWVKMTDGTTLEIRAVHFGTNLVALETPLTQLARRFLPQKWATRWLPQPITSLGGGTNDLSIAFTRRDSAGKKLRDFWDKIETIDSQSVVYIDNQSNSSIDAGNELLEFSITTFPRRDERFLVRMYDRKDTLQAQFMVKNPLFPREFPVWKAEPLPQTKTNADVKVTLKGLKAHKEDDGFYCNPDIKIEADDPSWRSRKRMYHSFVDATGNRGAFLSTNETAWRMDVALYRPDEAKFPTNLVWSLPLVSVPAALTFTNLQASNLIGGVSIQVPVICGAGTLTISNFTNFSVLGPVSRKNGWSYSEGGRSGRIDRHSSDRPYALVEAASSGGDVDLVLRFVDAQGKVLKSNRGGAFGANDPKRGLVWRHAVELLETNVEAAALEIKVNRALNFQFMIDPREIGYRNKR